jgi:hypothetical protein
MKSSFLPSIAALLLLTLSSCEKDKETPIITPAPKPLFSIKLEQQYVGSNQVDSAFAIWETNNQLQKVQLVPRNDSLIAEMSQFNEGIGKISFRIFSNKKFRNQYKTQFVGSRETTLKKSQAVNFNGPSSFLDTDWKPRVELWDGVGHAAVIGVRPDDPYFLVKDVKPGVTKLTIDKSYWKGLNMAGQGIFECKSGCTGNIENSTAFSSLPNQIGSKPWNHFEIYVVYEMDGNGGGWLLELTQDL